MPKTIVPLAGEPRRLARIGYLLYGAHHSEHLSRLLDVDRKTLYRWRSGATPVPARVWPALKVALMKRHADIDKMLTTLVV